jgi:hypothetical protein
MQLSIFILFTLFCYDEAIKSTSTLPSQMYFYHHQRLLDIPQQENPAKNEKSISMAIKSTTQKTNQQNMLLWQQGKVYFLPVHQYTVCCRSSSRHLELYEQDGKDPTMNIKNLLHCYTCMKGSIW